MRIGENRLAHDFNEDKMTYPLGVRFGLASADLQCLRRSLLSPRSFIHVLPRIALLLHQQYLLL